MSEGVVTVFCQRKKITDVGGINMIEPFAHLQLLKQPTSGHSFMVTI